MARTGFDALHRGLHGRRRGAAFAGERDAAPRHRASVEP